MTRTLSIAITALLLAAGLLTAPSTATAQVPADRTTTPAASWHHKHFHMNAFRRGGSAAHLTGRCNGSWQDDHGQCWGYGEQLADFHGKSYPFQNYLHWEWHRHANKCPDVPGGREHTIWRHEVLLETAHQGTGQGSHLCGWVDHGWNTMVVTGGLIVDHHGIKRPVSPTSGDVSKQEQQGGPLYVFLKAQDQGYVLGLRGYLEY